MKSILYTVVTILALSKAISSSQATEPPNPWQAALQNLGPEKLLKDWSDAVDKPPRFSFKIRANTEDWIKGYFMQDMVDHGYLTVENPGKKKLEDWPPLVIYAFSTRKKCRIEVFIQNPIKTPTATIQ